MPSFRLPPKSVAALKTIRPNLPAVARKVADVVGDVWSFHREPNTWVAVSTSADRQMSGQVARQAANKVPGLAEKYSSSSSPFMLANKSKLVMLPTKAAADAPQADLSVIEDSLKQLAEARRAGKVPGRIVLPQLGTGSGKLKWSAVEPIVQKHLGDIGDDLIVVKRGPSVRKIYPETFRPAPPVAKPAVDEAVQQAAEFGVPAAKPIAPKPASTPKVQPPTISKAVQGLLPDELYQAAEAEAQAYKLSKLASEGRRGVEPIAETLREKARKGINQAIQPKADRIAQNLDDILDDSASRAGIGDDSGIVRTQVKPISGGAITTQEIAQQKFFEVNDQSLVERVVQGAKLLGERGRGMLHPTQLARSHPKLQHILDQAYRFIDGKERMKLNEKNTIWGWIKDIPSDELSNKLAPALDGKMDPRSLSPELQGVYIKMRQWFDQWARRHGLRAEVGDHITLDLTGKPERYLVTRIDEAGQRVQLRGLTGTYGAGKRTTDTFWRPMSEAFPRYLHDYLPHMVKGDWFVVVPTFKGTRMSGYYKVPFATWGKAEAYIKNDLPKLFGLDRSLTKAELIQQGIYVEPIINIPQDVRTILSKNALGALTSAIKESVESRLLKLPNMPKTQNGRVVIDRDVLWAALTDEVRVAPSLRSFQHLMPRRLNLASYEKDFFKVISAYIDSSVNKVEGDKWRKLSFEILNGAPFGKNPGYLQYVRDPATQMTEGARPWHNYKWFSEFSQAIDSARPSQLEHFFDDIVNQLGGPANAYRKSIHGMARVMSVLKLSSPVSAFVNLTQTLFTTYPVLGSKPIMKAVDILFKLPKNPKLADEFGNNIHGLMKEIGTDLFVSKASLDQFQNKDWANLFLFFFNSAEKVNRAIAGLGGYYKARGVSLKALQSTLIKGGMLPAEVANMSHHQLAAAWAKRWALDFTQFRYGIEAVPAFMREPGMRLLFQFKPYLLNFLNYTLSIFERDRLGRLPGDTRNAEVTRFIITMGASAGLLGLPFTEMLDREIYKRSGWSFIETMREMVPDKVYNVSMRGLGTLLGVDLSTRIGFGADVETLGRAALYPDKFSLKDMMHLSPWFGMVSDAISAVGNLHRNRTEDAADRVLQVFIPLQLWYIYYATKQYTGKKWAIGSEESGYVQPGGVYSPAKGGAKITELYNPEGKPDLPTFLVKATGLRTTKESEASEESFRDEAIMERRRELQERYRRRIVQAWLSGRGDEARNLYNEAVSRGLDMSRLKEEAKQQQRTLLERTLRRIPKADRGKAIERARDIEDDLEVPSGRKRDL